MRKHVALLGSTELVGDEICARNGSELKEIYLHACPPTFPSTFRGKRLCGMSGGRPRPSIDVASTLAESLACFATHRGEPSTDASGPRHSARTDVGEASEAMQRLSFAAGGITSCV